MAGLCPAIFLSAILSNVMSQSVALYRKYRPADFAEVRNQEHIVSVLKGAIAKGTIPHALLFSGGRGTGKTTLARIFASAIGVTGVDLYEIDAASNRGIDDIRELRDAVHVSPYESAYKVYIIDEVHMLTKEAFNALLKTLEEPPAHVIFILATTEEDKLLDTILSRCQVFRFRSPSRAMLAETVTDVAKKEGFTFTPDSADLIASAAGGSFRDALGITQKVILASGDKIGSLDEVASIIGAPKQSLLLQVLKALQAKDLKSGLEAIAEAEKSNVDTDQFLRMILETVRTIMLVRHQPTRAEELTSSFNAEAKEQIIFCAGQSASPINSHLLVRLLETVVRTNKSPVPFLPLEILMVEHCGGQ